MMKRFSTAIVAALFCVMLSAQEHIRFMGFPVDGHIKEFAQQMKRSGFKCTTKNKKAGAWMFRGQFTGQDCDICVTFDKATSIVNSVMVYLPAETEKEAEVHIEKFDRMLAEKYPEASRNVRGLGRESHTEFRMPYGIISLWKSPASLERYRVAITYFDRINNTKKMETEKNDL